MEKDKQWSQKITENSNALTLEQGVFTWQDPKKIAGSLLQSALESSRRKGTSYQSAMSMLNFYINRAGKKRIARPDKESRTLIIRWPLK